MIYLENTTQSQQVYIPRQVIQTATTREINYITSGDVINIVDEKLEPYYNSAETDTQIENAVAAESARCEETYAKISDIPDVSDFITSADVKTQVEDYNYVNSADVKTQIEDYHYITSGQAQEQINQSLSGYATEQWVEDKHYLTEHQSLSGYASEEYVDNAVGGAIDYVDDQFSSYSQEFTGYLAEKQDITAMTAYYTSAETDTQIENAIAAEVERADSTYATPSDIPDVSDFVTYADLASYALSADVDTLVEDTIAAEVERTEETYAKPDDVSSAVNELTLGLAYLGVVNDVSESNGTVTITKTGLVSGEITTGLTDSFNLPDVSNFVTSADVETQITGKGYALSGDLQTLSGNVAQNAEDIYAVDNDLHTEYWNSARTVSELQYACEQLEDAIYIVVGEESGRTERTYAKIEDIPDVSNFVTSADVETQIDGNLSAYTPTSGFATINGSGITNGGNIVIQGGGGGVDSGLTERVDEIEEVTSRALNDLNSRFSGYTSTSDLNTRLSAYTPTSGFATINGSGITNGGNLVIQGGGSSYTAGDGIDITNDVISVTGRQETLVSGTNIKTINNQSLLGSGNIDIQGGGGNANIIELTQQEYDALTAYTEDALYVITDAEEVDLNDYATSADVATINTALGNKADKVTVTTNSSYYRFPKWNSQGIITGYTSQAYQASFNINGGSRTIYSTSSSAMPTIYAPTTAGNSGQVVVSNGIFGGAPSWSSFKFWYGSQSDYDAITTKDDSTIYFVKPD